MSATGFLAEEGRRRVSMFVKQVAAMVLAGLLIFAGIAFSARRQSCADRADGRADNRAMWEFLINLSPPEPDDPVGQAFVKELDIRLPLLECNWWGKPEPKEN